MIAVILALVFIVIILLIALVGQSNEFIVSREAVISASAKDVFTQVNELRNWEGWNPWGKLDPNYKLTYAGPAAGAGASYSWNGNNKVGAGCNTITESRPNERVRFRLEFSRPMKATNTVEFTFQPADRVTLVTWSMSGKRSIGSKAFGLLLNFDAMCGNQFEKGLAQMKSLVEAGRKNESPQNR